MSQVPVRIPEELVEFLESGISILVGTRDTNNRPLSMRGVGAKVSEDRTRLGVLLPDRVAEGTVQNARATRRVAVTFARALDNRSVQLKGTVEVVRPGDERDRLVLERYKEDFARILELIGMPRAITERVAVWPLTVVEIAIDCVFVQTPGPSAGVPLAEAGG